MNAYLLFVYDITFDANGRKLYHQLVPFHYDCLDPELVKI